MRERNVDVASLFAQVLKQARKEKKLSQKELGIASELDRTYISLMERSLRSPSITTLIQLGHGLDIRPSVLLERLDELRGKE